MSRGSVPKQPENVVHPLYSTPVPRHLLQQTNPRYRVASPIISLFVSFPFPDDIRTNYHLFLCVCVCLSCLLMGVVGLTTITIDSCDPSPRTRAHKEQRLQSSTTTTSSSSSYYLSAPSPPSMASRASVAGTQRRKGAPAHGSTADRMPSRWYTVLALPFPDQRLGRRDINTFGQGGIYTSSRAGYFSNQER